MKNALATTYGPFELAAMDCSRSSVYRQQSAPEFSPAGRWLAYLSNESGRPGVYVQPYPGPGAAHGGFTEGGREPAWSRDGRELFYTTLPSANSHIKMMAVAVSSTTEFRAGAPRALFEGRYVCPIRSACTTSLRMVSGS